MAASKKTESLPKAEVKAEPKAKAPAYIVVQAFQDSRAYQTTPTPTKYAVGEDVSHLDQDRLDKLLSLGIVKKG